MIVDIYKIQICIYVYTHTYMYIALTVQGAQILSMWGFHTSKGRYLLDTQEGVAIWGSCHFR